MGNPREIVKKNYWVFLLILIFVAALYLRAIPGTKLEYPRLQAIDPYYFFRMGEYILENGNLPENDGLAGWGTIPGGPNRRNDFVVTLWAYPTVYFILNPILGISWYWVGVWVPALFGALQVFFMYFLAKELFNSKKIGLLSAAFLASVPGILYRVSAGFIEKEPIAGLLMVLGLYFFVKSFKEKEIIKEFSWKRFLVHPISSIIHRMNTGDDNIKTIKTVAYALISGLLFALMAGAWGGVRIPLVIIGVFVIVSLMLNRFPRLLLYSHASMFVSFLLISRAFAVSPAITGVEVVVNFVALGLLAIRYAAEKSGLVRKEYLPYVVPALFFAGIFAVLVASYVYVELGEWVGFNIAKITNPLTMGVIPSTVAESQTAGDFLRSSVTSFGTGYAVNAFKMPAFMIYLSAIYFAAMGIVLMVYEFLFRRRDLEHILVVIMFLSMIVLATGAQRLAFVFAFPVSIAAGYFIIRGGGYALKWSGKLLKENGYKYVKITGGILIGLVVFTNFASGWVMANGIGSSLGNEWYQSLVWLRENTPEDAVVLEWWDFGWWFHYIGKKVTLVDGGYHSRRPTQDIATFFTSPFSDERLNFLKKYGVDYVMVSPDLIPKFGAMSKIANWGKKVDVLPVFNLINQYQEGNKALLEFSAGGQKVLVAYSMVTENGTTTMGNITAMIKTPQGQAFVRDVGIGDNVIKNDKPNAVPGMIYFAGNAVIYVPEPVEYSMFVRLYLFNGRGLEEYFEKVYDKLGMKIYRVKYENFPPEIKGDYVDIIDREESYLVS